MLNMSSSRIINVAFGYNVNRYTMEVEKSEELVKKYIKPNYPQRVWGVV